MPPLGFWEILYGMMVLIFHMVIWGLILVDVFAEISSHNENNSRGSNCFFYPKHDSWIQQSVGGIGKD
jgi:hypothetical protein